MKRSILSLLLVLSGLLPAWAQNTLTGHIIDEQTGDSIPLASAVYTGQHVAVVSDARGRYTIRRHNGWKLTFSAVGYKTRTITVNEKTRSPLNIYLPQDTKALGEVTVRSRRQRYSRKDNPAVELMRKVIANKRQTDLATRDYYQYTKYQKLTLALNDVKAQTLEKKLFKKHPFLREQVQKSPYNDRLILPLSVDETVTQKIYRRTPHSEKSIVTGEKSSGINDFFQTGDILNTMAKDVFTDVNIYDDQVRVLQFPFTSPIGKGAISFYRYYIEDTLVVDRDSCIHLHFLPNNQQDFGFRGDLYVLKDSSYQVKRCELVLPNQTGVNFVENLKIIQEFRPLDTGEWVLSVDDMVVELVLFDFLQKGVAIRSTRLSDYSFDAIPNERFRGRQKKLIDPYARMVDDNFWARHRKVELSKPEAQMGGFLSNLQRIGGFKYVLAGLKLLMENYIEIDKDAKFDFGPVNTVVSSNFVDGLRTRLSGQTTANLNPHLFLKGYVAHGWKSHGNYYSGEITWSMNKKKYLPHEFPKRNLTVLSTYDISAPSDKYLTHDKDNVFAAFKWAQVDAMMYYNRQQFTFEREEEWGLRTLLSLKTEWNKAAGTLAFLPLDRLPQGGTTANPTPINPVSDPSITFRTSELRAEVSYCPGALYVNTKQRRIRGNWDAPILTLSHTFGLKGFLGSNYGYNYSEASIYKRFWLNSWGRIDLFTRGGVQWSKVPFPLLCMPATNMSYVNNPQTFNLLRNMEFLNDRFVHVDINWDMQGKILNRIPLVKKLKFREYIGVKMLWGALSDKNNPALERNAGSHRLMAMPATTKLMNPDVPYWEISAGVRNILRFFEVEFVRRMNYNDGVHTKNGVRFGFDMTF